MMFSAWKAGTEDEVWEEGGREGEREREERMEVHVVVNGVPLHVRTDK